MQIIFVNRIQAERNNFFTILRYKFVSFDCHWITLRMNLFDAFLPDNEKIHFWAIFLASISFSRMKMFTTSQHQMDINPMV